jgi:O-antigen/teichoic acid export membrane protein
MTPARQHTPDSPDHNNGKPAEPIREGSKGLFRDAILNFWGQVLPLVFALVAIPFILKGFGLERFGLLSLAWLLLGYFAFLDLGLGRATVRFVAELIGREEKDKISGVVWASTGLNLIAGIVGGIAVWLLAPFLARRVFTIPPELIGEAQQIFVILAFAIPAITATASLRGVLEACRRFDLVNAVKVPSNIAVFLIPLIGLPLVLGLPVIVGLMVLTRIATALVYFGYSIRQIPGWWRRFALPAGQIRSLLQYGGWVTASNLLVPIISYAERFLIGALLPIGMLGYYTAPFEMISRLSVFPYSLALALFPAFSHAGTHDPAEVRERLVLRPSTYLLLLMTPLTALFVFFAPEILQLWLGADFRAQSGLLLQILAAAFFFNAFAYIPLTAVQGLGRPELKAKLDLVQAPLFVGLCWVLIKQLGIAGAAFAKLAVCAVDVIFILWFTKLILGANRRELFPKSIRVIGLASGFFLLAGFPLAMDERWLGWRIGLFLVLGFFYFLLFWKIAMPASDRLALRALRQRLTRTAPLSWQQKPGMDEIKEEPDLHRNIR